MFKLSKKQLLKVKKRVTADMILDKEIDVEAGWILLKEAERQRDEMISRTKKNLEEIKAERQKPKTDMEKVEKLVKENTELGWTGEKVKGKDTYKGRILAADVKVANYYSEIEKAVGEREYLKLRLQAVNKILKKGFVEDLNEELGKL